MPISEEDKPSGSKTSEGHAQKEKDPAACTDIQVILSHIDDLGGGLWTTPDRRILKGGPFSLVESILYLVELGMDPQEPVLRAGADLIFGLWQADGRFKTYPQGGIYPCQTAIAADVLCRLGYVADARIQTTLRHFLSTQYHDGGWRCNKFSFGRGPETEYSNPQPTLTVLSAFRYNEGYEQERVLDRAVEFLLNHWTIRKPIGPCHYGIGTLFMQVEYPMRGYNLFEYTYVLSFYEKARKDSRFLEAFAALRDKCKEGQIVVERVVPKLRNLSFCKKGQPSAAATKLYQEILCNMAKK